jgi:hypothetical protein
LLWFKRHEGCRFIPHANHYARHREAATTGTCSKVEQLMDFISATQRITVSQWSTTPQNTNPHNTLYTQSKLMDHFYYFFT